jgi:hypothetical protein
VQAVPAVAEPVPRSLIGPGEESVEGHGHVKNGCGHGVFFPGLRSTETVGAAKLIARPDDSARRSPVDEEAGCLVRDRITPALECDEGGPPGWHAPAMLTEGASSRRPVLMLTAGWDQCGVWALRERTLAPRRVLSGRRFFRGGCRCGWSTKRLAKVLAIFCKMVARFGPAPIGVVLFQRLAVR